MLAEPTPLPSMRIHDVVGGNLAWLEPLAALMLEYFPEAEGRMWRLHERAVCPPDADPHFVHHQWLLEIDGQAAGFDCFSYVPARNLGLGFYLAVPPAFRGLALGEHTHLAGWLHEAILQQLARDAATRGRPAPWGLAVEVSVPALVVQYQRYGLLPLPVPYLEPHFGPQTGDEDRRNEPQISWEPATLGLFPSGKPPNPRDPQLLNDVVSAFYIDHYGFATERPEVRRVLQAAASAAEDTGSAGGVIRE